MASSFTYLYHFQKKKKERKKFISFKYLFLDYMIKLISKKLIQVFSTFITILFYDNEILLQ